MTRTMLFGGARCGKSAHAEMLASASGKRVVYIASARSGDAEMQARIALHQQRRPVEWQTVEAPIALGAAIRAHGEPGNVLLIDCLTVWLSNLLFAGGQAFPEVGLITPPPAFFNERAAFLQAIEQSSCDLLLVTNEIGMGIVPLGAISRWFVDEAGRLNQAVAARCDRVLWVAAGLPLALKGPSC